MIYSDREAATIMSIAYIVLNKLGVNENEMSGILGWYLLGLKGNTAVTSNNPNKSANPLTPNDRWAWMAWLIEFKLFLSGDNLHIALTIIIHEISNLSLLFDSCVISSSLSFLCYLFLSSSLVSINNDP